MAENAWINKQDVATALINFRIPSLRKSLMASGIKNKWAAKPLLVILMQRKPRLKALLYMSKHTLDTLLDRIYK